MRRLKLILVLTAALVALAACSSDDESGGGGAATETDAESTDAGAGGGAYGGGETETAEAPAGGTALTATGNAWSPAALQLTAGAAASVTVENADGVLHSFTFEDAQVDQDIEGGQTATIDFTAPAAGEYTFVCKYHSSMTGTVTVA